MGFKFKLLLTTTIIALTVVIFMLSPFFTINYVIVSGIMSQDEQALIARAGLDEEPNIFLFSVGRARDAILSNPYIDSVEFRRVLPDSLYITVQQRFPIGYIRHLEGRYLYIDEKGRLLEVASCKREHFPIITGLNFTSARLGEILKLDNPEALGGLVVYSRLLNNHMLSSEIIRLDVSNSSNTRMRIYNVEVHLGDTRDSTEKISTLVQIIEEWPEIREASAILDLRDISNRYILRLLT